MKLPPLAEFDSENQRTLWLARNCIITPDKLNPFPSCEIRPDWRQASGNRDIRLLVAATLCLAAMLPILWLFAEVNR